MPNAEVAITVGTNDEDHPGDQVQFLLAANPGAPLLPLTKVASGGELARTMLALRLVLTDLDGDAARALVEPLELVKAARRLIAVDPHGGDVVPVLAAQVA